MKNYLTRIAEEEHTKTCYYRISITKEFGTFGERLVSQTGVREASRDKAASISKYVAEKYLSKEEPFQGSELDIKITLGGELVIAVRNLSKETIRKYNSFNGIPDEKELYEDRLEKFVLKGIREWCSESVFDKGLQ